MSVQDKLRVFISFADKDNRDYENMVGKWAKGLKTTLTVDDENPPNVFFYPTSQNPGNRVEEWQNEELDRCDWFMAFVSERYLTSDKESYRWKELKRGIERANKGECVLIFVCIEEINPEIVPIYEKHFEEFKKLHWLSLGDNEDGIKYNYLRGLPTDAWKKGLPYDVEKFMRDAAKKFQLWINAGRKSGQRYEEGTLIPARYLEDWEEPPQGTTNLASEESSQDVTLDRVSIIVSKPMLAVDVTDESNMIQIDREDPCWSVMEFFSELLKEQGASQKEVAAWLGQKN